MIRYYCRHPSENAISWISPIVNSKDGVDLDMLFTLRLLQ
jgi:hypothetical protein